MARTSLFVRPLEQGEMEFLAHLRKSRRQALRQHAQILRASMVYTPVYPDRADLSDRRGSRAPRDPRLQEYGFESPNPKVGTGRPPTFEPALRERIVAIALTPPTTLGEPLTHWSLRRRKGYLERRVVRSIAVETLRCILPEKNVTSQRTRSWKRRTDPAFEEKAARIMALYRTCPADGVVVCFDELGPILLQPYLGHCYAQRKRPWRRRATYVRRGGVGDFFGAYDVHADVLFCGYRLAKTATEVFAFYRSIRRRYPDRLRIYLVNDNLSLHWTPQIREWAASHNVELVPTPTSASHLNRIECHFRPMREFVINASDYASHAELWSPSVPMSVGATPTITPAASA